MATYLKDKTHLFPWFLSGLSGLVVGAMVATALAASVASWHLVVWLGAFWLTGGTAMALSFLLLEGLYYILMVLPARTLPAPPARTPLKVLRPELTMESRQAA